MITSRCRTQGLGEQLAMLHDLPPLETVPHSMTAGHQPPPFSSFTAHTTTSVSLRRFGLPDPMTEERCQPSDARLGTSQEQTMADRLARSFDEAVDASLRERDPDAVEVELISYLRDAHAIEAQALQLLEAGRALAGADPLEDVFREHLHETREHQRLVDERLRAHSARPLLFQDTALRIGGLNMSAFFAAQPDTPAKLAGFTFAFEHLDIAAYGLLRRIAQRVNDSDTIITTNRILIQERATAARIAATWDTAMAAALTNMDVASANEFQRSGF